VTAPPGQIRPGIPRGMGCAVVATPRDASKQRGQDRVRTLSAVARSSAVALRGVLLAQRMLLPVGPTYPPHGPGGPEPQRGRAANVVSTPSQ
jgi:hypothetical protein